MGGLGIKDTHVTELIEHIKVLLDHGPTVTGAGKSFRIVAEATTIERGCRGNIYDADATKYPWVDHGPRFRICILLVQYIITE